MLNVNVSQRVPVKRCVKSVVKVLLQPHSSKKQPKQLETKSYGVVNNGLR